MPWLQLLSFSVGDLSTMAISYFDNAKVFKVVLLTSIVKQQSSDKNRFMAGLTEQNSGFTDNF